MRSRRPCGPGRGRRWRGGTPRTGCGATPLPAAEPASAPAPGRGAGVPNLVTSSRQARNASLPATRCSMHRRNERLQHPPRPAQPQMRHPAVGGGDGRLLGGEAGCVVVGAEQCGQRFGEFRCAASPCLAVDGVGRRPADPRGHRPAGHQAGAPDRAVGGEPVARVAPAAAQRRQRVTGTRGPGNTTLASTAVIRRSLRGSFWHSDDVIVTLIPDSVFSSGGTDRHANRLASAGGTGEGVSLGVDGRLFAPALHPAPAMACRDGADSRSGARMCARPCWTPSPVSSLIAAPLTYAAPVWTSRATCWSDFVDGGKCLRSTFMLLGWLCGADSRTTPRCGPQPAWSCCTPSRCCRTT